MNGIINVLKPPGMTSHDVVSYIRKISGIKKVGHTGTLDPGAAGVLPICIGKATKLVDYITAKDKTYICEITFGKETDTYDKYGKTLTEYKEQISLDYGLLKKILKDNFTGDIEQIPPAYSAIKIDGKRAYDLARSGEEVNIPKREVTIYDNKLIRIKDNTAIIKINCSKGTYIRSICYDIGKITGYGAYMSFLLRVKTGVFDIKNAIPISDITKENIKNVMLTMDSVLEFEEITLNDIETKRFINGALVNKKISNGMYKVYSDNLFLGTGTIKNNKLKVDKLLL